MLTIGQVARAAGVSVETVRFYERRKLIQQPLKPHSGIRTYPDDTVSRIKLIRNARKVGFSLREIEALMSIRAQPDSQCLQVLERVRAKVAAIERELASLTEKRDLLRKAIETCPARGPASECPIFKTFEGACCD